VEDFDVKGLLTVVFLKNKGNERRALRLVEFKGPTEFTRLMEKIKQRRKAMLKVRFFLNEPNGAP
jgi:hypothetical protein